MVANAVAASIYPTERTYTDHYYKRFLQFEEEPAIGPEDIVMLGNSLTEAGKDWGARLKKKKSQPAAKAAKRLERTHRP